MPFLAFGISGVSAGILSLLLPETLNKPIAECIEDLQSPAYQLLNKVRHQRMERKVHYLENGLMCSLCQFSSSPIRPAVSTFLAKSALCSNLNSTLNQVGNLLCIISSHRNNALLRFWILRFLEMFY